MTIYKYIRNAFFCFFIVISGCKNVASHRAKPVYHITLDSTYCCDSNTQKVYARYHSCWPVNKPRSIVEAVRLLDSIGDDNCRNAIVNCPFTEFYFSLGLTIRNQWVRHGEKQLNDEFDSRLKITNTDYTSGVILYFYKIYLLDSNVSVERSRLFDDTVVASEIHEIQKQLIEMRNHVTILVSKHR
jgi:hypothetical protein